MALLEAIDISKHYPDGTDSHCVVENANFEIFHDDFVGLWGKRWAGKSTLLRILSGQERPDRGRVIFNGTRLTGPIDRAREDIAVASFGRRSPGDLIVSSYVVPGERQRDYPAGNDPSQMAREALDRVGALGFESRRLGELSWEQYIRVELAKALTCKPKLLLIDDPPRLHKPRQNQAISDLIAMLGEDPDHALLVASSELDLTIRADRNMIIGGGRLRVMGESATVIPFPAPYTPVA
jgi:NitT/TauT family transport system ATP-binding protein